MHTKRLPLWIPYDPEPTTPTRCATRIAERAEAYRADYRAYVDEYGDERPSRPTPTRAIVLIQHLGLVAVGTTTKASKLSRDLYHRAIEVMAGAHALDEFVSLDAAESFAIEYWPLELYKLAQAPPPGELQGRVALVTGGAGGIGRAIVRRARRRRRVRGRVRPRPGRRRGRGRRPTATAASRSAATSRARTAVAAAFAAAVERYRRRRHRRLQRRRRLQRARSRRRRSPSGTATTPSSAPATSSSRARRSGSCAQQGIGGSIVFIASKNALVAGKNAAAYSSAKAAELHLARCLAEEGGGAGIRVNTVNPDAVLQGSRIWDSSWREERAAAYGIEPDELEEHYRKRTTLRVNIFPEDIAAGRPALRLRPRARARARATCSTSTGACRRPTRAS